MRGAALMRRASAPAAHWLTLTPLAAGYPTPITTTPTDHVASPPIAVGFATPAGSRGYAAPPPQTVSLDVPTFTIWGANTDVGKTLVSVGLAAAVERAQGDLLYLKPVQTGYPGDSDARLVCAATGGFETVGPHAAELLDGALAGGDASSITAKTLFAWRQAVSPHLAMENEGRPVSDAEVREATLAELARFAGAPSTAPLRLALLESAGGVASPGPSGSLQAELLRPLRLPGVLVGDPRLGGISATISALESLQVRGMDTAAVVMTEGDLSNGAAISKHLRGAIPVISLPDCQRPQGDPSGAGVDAQLEAWLAQSAPQMDALLQALLAYHGKRVERLQSMAGEARRLLWWPFTQHANISNDLVTVIDSRCGDDFAVFQPQAGTIQAQFDACASWWTQGLGAELQPLVAREIGYAAGRYGHVMYPENAHEPALRLAEQLLEGPGAGWAARVFYSDNGSTALEVAVKMALRKYIMDHETPSDESVAEGTVEGPELHVVGLTESYHGDTLGCMDLSGPSPFNGRMQMPWYRPRGLFLYPATVGMRNGLWNISPPDQYGLCPDELETEFEDLSEVFCAARRRGDRLAAEYRRYINTALDGHHKKLGACVMEPVLQGAGGMRMLDPLWQLLVMEACRERGIPVVLDEVFTGLWRLGRISAAEMMGAKPDVACYAKLLTGGMVPLAATVATEEVFQAFDGPTKVESLLHGHSYTAHPIGCHTATVSLAAYTDPGMNPNFLPAPPAEAAGPSGCPLPTCECAAAAHSGASATLWDEALVKEISFLPQVERVVALGTVFVAELSPERGGGGGYLSSQARRVTEKLRTEGVFARPLGNVVYLMGSPMSSRERCADLLRQLIKQL
eukprot:jgi/Tetstr1/433299/TSEL_022586.t1